MYLSRVLLNDRRRETMRALASPQIIHAAVESSYDHHSRSEMQNKRLLWRIDYVGDKCYLLLLSPGQPDLSLIVGQFGTPGLSQGETRPYKPLLDRVEQGQRWRFRLRANPVRSSMKDAQEGARRGRVHAHVTSAQQKEWLLVRTEASGFALAAEEFDVVHTEWKKFHKAGAGIHEVVLRTATYEGILTVVDAERFTHALTSGIGRAKAYGCGMLTIMPIREG